MSIFQRKKKRNTDLIVHYLTTEHLVTGFEGEKLDLRFKVSLAPSGSLAGPVQAINRNLVFSSKMLEVGVIWYRGEEAVAVDLNKPVAPMMLNKANREKDLVLVNTLKMNKKVKKNRKPKTLFTPSTVIDEAIPGEIIFFQLPTYLIGLPKKEVKENLAKTEGETATLVLVSGTLYFSNYRISFVEQTELNLDFSVPDKKKIENFSIPISSLKRIKKKKRESFYTVDKSTQKSKKTKFLLVSLYQDFRKITLGWEEKKEKKDYLNFEKIVEQYYLQESMAKFCFFNLEKFSFEVTSTNGWDICEPSLELARWNLHFSESKYFSVFDSPKYIFNSLPKKIIVPVSKKHSFSEKNLLTYAKQHPKGRFPTLVWGCTSKEFDRSLLFRCERPHSGVIDKSLIQAISVFNKKIIIYDTGNKPEGFQENGIEHEFLELPTLKELITSLNGISQLILYDRPLSPDFFNQLDQTKWLEYIGKTLFAVQSVVKNLQKPRSSVIIQNGGSNYENDSIIVSLVEIAVDPFYRTLEGFCKLFDREWFQFSFRFKSLLAKSETSNKDITLGLSIFVLFFNSLWEIHQQNTAAFEFTENLIIFIMDSIISNRFGNFLEDHRAAGQYEEETVSIWLYLLDSGLERFKNQLYDGGGGSAVVVSDFPQRDTRGSLWTSYFLRYNFELQFKQKRFYEQLKATLTKTSPEDLFSEEEKVDKMLVSGVETEIFEFDGSLFLDFNQLKELVMKNNRLTTIPRCLAQFESLKKFFLEDTNVSHVSDIFRHLPNLVNISLQHNKIETLPDSFGKLDQLQTLFLSNNQIVKIKDNFFNFEKLTRLEIRDNRLKSLPTSIANLKNLENLSLSQNHLSTIERDILSHLSKLKILDISENQVKSIPDSIGCLTNLTLFIMRDNKVGDIPEGIGGCSSLLELDASQNSIIHFPASIKNLKNLHTLRLNSNRISSIGTILGCKSIKKLFLAGNRIRDVPLHISDLSSLNELNLQNNLLVDLTVGIGACVSLTSLDLRKNSLNDIPETLANIPALKDLQVDFTDFSNIPQEHRSSTESILSYLRSLLEGNRKNVRIKILVFGKEKVGKSVLISKISKNWTSEIGNITLSEISQKKAPVASENGIDIATFLYHSEPHTKSPRRSTTIVTPPIFLTNPKKLNKKRTGITVKIWDFADHDVLYNVQEVFLSAGSVFLLLFSLSDPSTLERVEYWLQYLSLVAPKSCVVVVGTHADEESVGNVDQAIKKFNEGVRKSISKNVFRNFSPFLIACISGSTDYGIEELLKKIEDAVVKEKKIVEQIPTVYYLLENHLIILGRKLKTPVITWQYFETLASFYGIKSSNELSLAVKVFSEMGMILHFDIHPCLKNIIFLDPNWLSKVISSLFSTKHPALKTGILKHTSLNQFSKEYPSEFLFPILFLLHYHEVLYEVKLEHLGKLNFPSLKDEPSCNNDFTDGRRKFSKMMLNSVQKKLEIDLAPIDLDLSFDMPSVNESTVSISPSLLPKDKPNYLIDHIFPSKADPFEVEFSRTFTFKLFPRIVFSRLMIKLISIGNPIVMWNRGIIVDTNPGNCMLECVDTPEGPIDMTFISRSTNKENSQLTFLMFLDFFEDMRLDYENLLVKKLVPVPSLGVVLPLEDFEDCIIKGETTITAGENTLDITNIAPDLTLSFFKGETIDYAQFQILGNIGAGGYASVDKATIDNNVVAIKKLNLANMNDPEARSRVFSDFRREVAIQAKFAHPNIVKLHSICVKPFCIISELADRGNLFDYIHDKEYISWKMSIKFALDIANGMKYMHAQSIVHLDLKSPNVLLCTDNKRIHAKIADFGTSRAFEKGGLLSGKLVDNPVWLAPEIMLQKKYTHKVDVYAFGIICWEIMTRRNFFDCGFLSEIEKKVVNGEREPLEPCPEGYDQIVVCCWDTYPDVRPEFEVVVEKLKSIKISDKMETQRLQDWENRNKIPSAPDLPPINKSQDEPKSLTATTDSQPTIPTLEEDQTEPSSPGSKHIIRKKSYLRTSIHRKTSLAEVTSETSSASSKRKRKTASFLRAVDIERSPSKPGEGAGSPEVHKAVPWSASLEEERTGVEKKWRSAEKKSSTPTMEKKFSLDKKSKKQHKKKEKAIASSVEFSTNLAKTNSTPLNLLSAQSKSSLSLLPPFEDAPQLIQTAPNLHRSKSSYGRFSHDHKIVNQKNEQT